MPLRRESLKLSPVEVFREEPTNEALPGLILQVDAVEMIY
jgi:hypothetical protein